MTFYIIRFFVEFTMLTEADPEIKLILAMSHQGGESFWPCLARLNSKFTGHLKRQYNIIQTRRRIETVNFQLFSKSSSDRMKSVCLLFDSIIYLINQFPCQNVWDCVDEVGLTL